MTDLVLDTFPYVDQHQANGHDQRQAQVTFDTLGFALSGSELVALVEALLLVSPEPVSVAHLARGAEVDVGAIEEALAELETASSRGWIIQRHAETVQISTAPRFAEQIRRFLGLERETKLSSAALETLAIVAYQQPVTRSEIEAVRGVDSSGVLSTLMSRGLVEIVGRLATVGNPMQYGTTPGFLLHFGMGSLADLPPLGLVDGRDIANALQSAVAAADENSAHQPESEPEGLTNSGA
jgi:segregation and condensation protein B